MYASFQDSFTAFPALTENNLPNRRAVAPTPKFKLGGLKNHKIIYMSVNVYTVLMAVDVYVDIGG